MRSVFNLRLEHVAGDSDNTACDGGVNAELLALYQHPKTDDEHNKREGLTAYTIQRANEGSEVELQAFQKDEKEEAQDDDQRHGPCHQIVDNDCELVHAFLLSS